MTYKSKFVILHMRDEKAGFNKISPQSTCFQAIKDL